MKANKLKLAICAGAAIFAVSMTNTATAGTASDNIAVSADVAASCTITANPVAFGTYDPSAVKEATGSVSVTCTKGATGTYIGLGQGAHYTTGRNMLGGTSGDNLAYELYQPADGHSGTACAAPHASGILWTTSNPANTLAPLDAWTGAAQTFNVCGSIPAGQFVGADASYTDTVSAVINF
jgi:spore coat protein U-like protein